MSQPREVMAFRKRARRLGYRDIVIEYIVADCYEVRAVEPLAGVTVVKEYERGQFSRSLRPVRVTDQHVTPKVTDQHVTPKEVNLYA